MHACSGDEEPQPAQEPPTKTEMHLALCQRCSPHSDAPTYTTPRTQPGASCKQRAIRCTPFQLDREPEPSHNGHLQCWQVHTTNTQARVAACQQDSNACFGSSLSNNTTHRLAHCLPWHTTLWTQLTAYSPIQPHTAGIRPCSPSLNCHKHTPSSEPCSWQGSAVEHAVQQWLHAADLVCGGGGCSSHTLCHAAARQLHQTTEIGTQHTAP